MEKVKIKTKQKEGKVEICFYKGKTEIGNITKHINTCMVCKKTTVDDKQLGSKHICSECLELIKKSTGIEEPKKVIQPKLVEEPKKEVCAVKARNCFSVSGYKASIKLVDAKQYQNLQPVNQVITEKAMTILIDLIIKGYNTVDKIAHQLNGVKKQTIYTYLRRMARIGMVYNVGKQRKNQVKYTQIYKVASALVYTAV